MQTEIEKLNNPVWYCLQETHQEFGINYADKLRCYQPEYCVFGAFEVAKEAKVHIGEYATLAQNFFMVGEKPFIPENLNLKKEVLCNQMIIEQPIDLEIQAKIVALKPEHLEALYQLICFVYPGYFQRKTALLGTYFGIFEENELIAVSGKRLQMNNFSEISSVVTHPKYQGKGYAKQLVAHTVNDILSQNKTPYLHVWEKNTNAISLYEKLGFQFRRNMSFWNISAT